MQHLTRLRRVLFAVLAVGLAAAAAIATAGDRHAFRAHSNVVAVQCAGGLVADADGGRCVRPGSVEGPIESFVLAEQRALKQTAPFQTVAQGAFANAIAQRTKKQKTGGAWQPLGQGPLHADSPDYAGSDPVLTAGPSQLGWKNLSGRITAFAYDPKNANRLFAAPATGGVWESTNGGGN